MKKNFFFLCLLISGVVFINGCSDEDDDNNNNNNNNNNNENWAAAVVGTYKGGGTRCLAPIDSSTTIITRVNNNTFDLELTITYSNTAFPGTESYCYTNIPMSTATLFNFNQFENCLWVDRSIGDGSFNGNTISFTIEHNPVSGPPECEVTVNGSK